MNIDAREGTFGLPAIGIPAEVLFHPELTMTERVLFGYIRNLSQGSKGCYASNRWLGQLLQLGSQTISNSIASLKKWGFIEVEMIQKRGSKEIERRIFIDDGYSKRYKKMVKLIHDILRDEGELIQDDYKRIKKLICSYQESYRKEEREEEREPTPKPLKSARRKTSFSVEELLQLFPKDFQRSDSFKEAFDDYVRYKREDTKRPVTSSMTKAMITQIKNHELSIEEVTEQLLNCVASGWQGANLNNVKKFSNNRTSGGKRTIGYGHQAKQKIYGEPDIIINNEDYL